VDRPLAAARTAAGVSQAALARELGISRKSINQTERRERERLGIRLDTEDRYLAGLRRLIERRRAVVTATAELLQEVVAL
jgi:transcriptional regulator with XRE-family HTH domain